MGTASSRLVASTGLAGALLIVAYGGFNLWLSGRDGHAPPPAAPSAPVTVEVWAAGRAIGRGERIAAGDLRAVTLQGTAPPGLQTREQAIIGKIAVVDIPAAALITADTVTDDPARAGLALMVPAGLRAVALRTNEEIAVGNFIRPGDHVDVELVLKPRGPLGAATATSAADQAEARTLLQDVTVLSVGSTLADHPPGSQPASRDTRRPEPPHVVTLALAPEQISRLALARSLGELFLALRNPGDIASVAAQTVHLGDLRGPLPPPLAARIEQRRPIELITGSKRTVIYSTAPDGTR